LGNFRAFGDIILRGGKVQIMGMIVGSFGSRSSFGPGRVFGPEEVLDQVGPSFLLLKSLPRPRARYK